MIKFNYHIAIDSIRDHVRYSSYDYPSMFSTNILLDQINVTSLLVVKKLKSIFNIFFLFNTEIISICINLSRYLLSFELIKIAYETVAVPLLSMYDFTKFVLFFLQYMIKKVQFI